MSEGLEKANATSSRIDNAFHPYPNENAYLLGEWYWNQGKQKSNQSFKKLLDVVANPNFRPEDVRHTHWSKIDAALGCNNFDGVPKDNSQPEWMDHDVGWKRTPISISVPFNHRATVSGPKEYIVGDLYHRSLVSVILEKLSQPHDIQHFHYEPFEVFWQPTNATTEVRVHGEFYTSPAFLDAHRELQGSLGEPGCDLPRVIVAMIFASDATQLTSFGDAKLWPCYLFFGNESKYRRCKPACHLCNHVTYFQDVSHLHLSRCFMIHITSQLPDAFKDFAAEHQGGKGPSEALVTHCHREVIQAQWKLLLDEEFVEAWAHGVVHNCCDGIRRRFYPWVFLQSSDYKEKCVVLPMLPWKQQLTMRRVYTSCIRNMGDFPCPRCLIPLSRFQYLGTALDRKQRNDLARIDDETRRDKIRTAREIIYQKRYAVDSEHVDAILKAQSLVPTVVSSMMRMVCSDGLMMCCRMHSRKGLPPWGFTFFQCLLWI